MAWRSCDGARRETVRWQRVTSETLGAHRLPGSRPGTVIAMEAAAGPWCSRPWRRWPGSDSEVLVPAIEAKGGLNPSIGFSGESKDSTAAPERGTTESIRGTSSRRHSGGARLRENRGIVGPGLIQLHYRVCADGAKLYGHSSICEVSEVSENGRVATALRRATMAAR